MDSGDNGANNIYIPSHYFHSVRPHLYLALGLTSSGGAVSQEEYANESGEQITV